MRKFFIEIGIAFVALFVLNLFVFYIIINPTVYQPYEMVMENVSSRKLIFADSHGWSLTNGYEQGTTMLKENGIENLSYGSDSYFDIYFKLKYLINNNQSIDTLFISADPHMIGKKRVINNNRDRSIVFSEYKEYKKYFNISYPEFIFRKYIRKYISTFDTNNSKLIQEFLESKISSPKKDFVLEWNDLSSIQKSSSAANKHDDFYKNGVSKKQLEVLEDIFKLCKKNQIVVIGVKFPSAIDLKKLNYPSSFDIASIIFHEFSACMMDFKFYEDYFFENQDHVNNKGADRIIKEIVSFNNANINCN